MCVTCGQGFVVASRLARMSDAHGRETLCVDDLARAGFAQAGDLVLHARTRWGTKPFDLRVGLCSGRQLT